MRSRKGCNGWNYHVPAFPSGRCVMCGASDKTVRAERDAAEQKRATR